MENINGALGFTATLDINDFNVSADAMAQHIRQVSSDIQSESASMEESLMNFAQKGAMYITSYLTGKSMVELLNSIVQTRGQFQQLEIAFSTMLGSEEKATTLMNQMVQTAAKTPFDLQGVAGGAKQLLAYGESADKVNDTLVRLGNIASGLSIPLNDIVYLYGTTMVQGRLYAQDVRQFTGRGIPLVKELAKEYGVTAEEINNMVSAGKIGFEDVQLVLKKMTDQGGQFYNLMEKQSASLTGQISNLEDAWDSMLNDLGKQSQGVLSDAISSVSYMVEHYEKILSVIKAVTIAYGSYRAALVLNTLATKGYTGVALLDNTARQAKLALLRMDARLSGQVAAQTDAMTTAQQAHIASLQAELTADELATLQTKLRVATIQQLLTAQQAQYLSNLGLTTASEKYEAAAMGILTVDQQESLRKTDLSSKSAIYAAALEKEVAAKRQSQAATLETMRADVSAASAKLQAAKASAVASMQATESARYEVYWARLSGDATRVATAEKKLEAAQDNQVMARKAALAAQTDFYTKKKLLEATASRQSTAASVADATAKGAQTAATSLLAAATQRATTAVKGLWAAFKANPLGWIVSIIGLVVSAISLFGEKEDEVEGVMGEFQKTTTDEINNLKILFSVLQNTEKGTKAHKDAVDKINSVCTDYNKTLLNENSTLEEQRNKYNELTKAIQSTTAEKLRSKYAEQALNDAMEEQATALDKLKDKAKNASYQKDTGRTRYDRSTASEVPVYETVQIESIQNASQAIWDSVESLALSEAAKLKGLTGKAYEEAFNNALANITKSVQQATGASDVEMQSFSANLSSYLTSIVGSAKTAQDQIDRTDRQLALFFAPKDTTGVVSSTDYVSMSFEDLEKKAQETQAEIDKINAKQVRVDTDNTKLLELKDLLDQINGAIKTKSNNLNTDAGISARIKQLKDENAELEYGSKKRKENAEEIVRLQNKMDRNNLTRRTTPRSSGGGGHRGGGTANNAAQNAEQLERQQLEAQRKLEQARIDVMEDGYAKQKAILDLELKEQLDTINQEEKELAKARKKAGKGSLSADEKAGFEERRKDAQKGYDVKSTKLFDAEIDYRKKTYASYFSWVENVGKDVADAHFADLLKQGTSFTEWVDSQVKQLEEKKASTPGEFSNADASALDALKIQQNEIHGVKSAMDLFRESVSETLGQTQNLADKLEAIAKLKEKLADGDFHLNADDTTQAAVELDQQNADAQKEVQDKVLTVYQTYEEQKLSIQKEYEALRAEAQRMGDENRLKQIDEAENEALSTLNAKMLMQSDAWKNLFTDLDTLTVDEIDKLINEIQEKMSTADLQLNPSDLNALLDKLDEAKKKVLDTNPFKAMGSALSAVFKTTQNGSEKTSKQIKRDWSNLADATKGSFDFIEDAVDSCDVLKDLLGDTGQAMISMLGGMAQAGIAMADAIKTAEKGSVILAAISMALQAIQFISTLFNKDDELEEKIQNIQMEIDALTSAMNRLKSVMDRTYWVFSPEEEEAYQERIQATKSQIALLEQQAIAQRKAFNFKGYAETRKQIKELQYTLEKVTNQGDMFDLYKVQEESLRKQQDLIREQIEAEKGKKKTDWSKIQDWEEKIKDIDTQIDEMKASMVETLAGTDVKSAIDDFADALVQAYEQGEDAAEALGDKTKEVLKNAVVEALKRRFLAKGINDAVEYLASAMEDSTLTEDERSQFTNMVNFAGEQFNTALQNVGDLVGKTDTEKDALTGAVQSLSEDTGNLVAGRMNAVIINQGEMNNQMRQSLIYQAEIAQNTGSTASELKEIKATLREIKNSGNSLLSQGIS